ncbi:uncharacterized protein AMSG_01298 [Thecamonas trahens ATCC 50062]|uniref:Uncharacterized protein n=1 Tax=Thecamonas trahens ATCC 50062 TaxID=461836 RepID=A0A0L0DQB3_THETB|nr:hypothetical protein AMSG_01298 [Thecamonas trahens ATCC 50062]KNC53588.1 hypothetical protein AMSG_01298 [Thecamonas trahens ATCC 50062]|eukprot:XP_013761905.1 hypothetical protein AMSG_01298 [Thecamonas trahens ATCC 50062]
MSAQQCKGGCGFYAGGDSPYCSKCAQDVAKGRELGSLEKAEKAAKAAAWAAVRARENVDQAAFEALGDAIHAMDSITPTLLWPMVEDLVFSPSQGLALARLVEAAVADDDHERKYMLGHVIYSRVSDLHSLDELASSENTRPPWPGVTGYFYPHEAHDPHRRDWAPPDHSSTFWY